MRLASTTTLLIWVTLLISPATISAQQPEGDLPEEYYTGGIMGTVFNTTSRCFEQPSPAIEEAGLGEEFLLGEGFFEGNFVTTTKPEVPFGGLGPVYIKSSCISCHPGYGRSKRVDNFNQEFGNGYIAFVHNPDGSICAGYTVMLQTKTVHPYVPPAGGVKITWNEFVDKHGNRYPDGTPYNQGKFYEGSLTYPTADLIDPLLPLPDDYRVSLQATIGIYGTGLLDAIRDEDIIAEYERQKAMPGPIKGKHGPWVYEEHEGKKRLGKFNWHCNRATLQNGPGFNGLHSVFNITRKDRPNLYATEEWIATQGELGFNTSKLRGRQPVELSQKDLDNFMIWHRGLAVPAARNLDDPKVQLGKDLFYQARCVECHRPNYVTGDYPYLPAYANQKIWPYTDLLMHDMGEENKGRFREYRTPPLWGRGLMKNAANHTHMFHDLRARDFEEAILWHFGEAEESREAFRNFTQEEREALIEFLKAI